MTSVPADLPSLLSVRVEGHVGFQVAGIALVDRLTVRALGVLRALLTVDSEAFVTTHSAVSEVRYSSHSFSFADEVDLVRRDVANVEIMGSIPIIRSKDT